MRRLGLLGLLLLLACEGDPLEEERAKNGSSGRVPSEGEMTVYAEGIVRDALRDPGSAQFRNVRVHRGKDGIRLVCGEVNSKNGFGGYSGFQRFISGGKQLTFIESQVSDFGTVWTRFCE